MATGDYSVSDINLYMDQLLPSSGYILCPGIKEYPEQIRFKTKHLMEWDRPFNRKFSDSCSFWFNPRSINQHHCDACHKLEHDIKYLAHRADSTTDLQKISRTLPSSKYPISKLSPSSQKKRMNNTTAERKQLFNKVKRLTQFECEVSDKQHEELLKLVKSVNEKHSRVIQDLISEGDRQLAENNLLKESWKQDVVERLSFENDQRKSVSKCRGNRWNQITIRMALAVFTRSPAAYEALRNFKLLQLPCVKTLKHYINANVENAGDSISRLQHKWVEYESMLAERAKQSLTGKKELSPLAQGSLIMDEVKVGMKLLWSSRNQKFIGHAMTHDEMSSLSDVYAALSPDYRNRRTNYVLQTLWRDLTSDFDVIGPHFTSDNPFSHEFLCRILMESIHQFHVCGFETVAVVCDGAAQNMTMIKEMSGYPRKAFNNNPDAYAVNPSFFSPYTGKRVYFIICPSHQLKNMISALFQSRDTESGGTRHFKIGECNFGWKIIEDMYYREVTRMRAGQCTRIPKLKESYIRRDAWTRLNVLPSKVMQQDEVLAELKEYARSREKPSDFEAVELTISYLEALNKIFEKSIIGKHVRVFHDNGFTIQRMSEGFKFFSDWAKTKKDNKSFLAWQTWDLLRIMWFGFKGLVKDFLTQHPGYHVNPKRLNGSSVETLFSQLKHTTAGNLNAANYETAKATMLTKIQSGRRKDDDYRTDTLYLRQSSLVKIK